MTLQLLFANLGIALGLSFLDWSPNRELSDEVEHPDKLSKESSEQSSEESSGQSLDASTEKPLKTPSAEQSKQSARSRPITHLLGFGITLAFSFTIFIAALISTEFSQLIEPRRGIIFGLIVWAIYWLLCLWLSATTLTGIADSLIGNAVAGGKQLIATLKQLFLKTGDTKAEPSAEQTMLQQLSEQVDQLTNQQQEFPELLKYQRETLLAEIDKRTEQSTKEAESVTHPLAHNKDVATQTEIRIDTPSEASTDSAVTAVTASVAPTQETLLSQLDLPSWQQILQHTLNKVDLSKWDVETIWQQVPISEEKVQHTATQLKESAIAILPDTTARNNDGAKRASPIAKNTEPSAKQLAAIQTIQEKLIAYCRYTNIESLTPEKLTEKVQTQREEHGFSAERQMPASLLDIDEIASTLKRRKNLSAHKHNQLIQALKSAWPVVSEPATETVTDDSVSIRNTAEKTAEKAYAALDKRLQSVDWSKVSLEDIKPEINLILEQLDNKGTLQTVDWQALAARIQLPATARKIVQEELTTWLQSAWDSKVKPLRPAAISTAKSLSNQITGQLSSQLSEQITQYLHHRQKSDLQPQQLMENMTQLVGSAIATLPSSTDPWHTTPWDTKLWDTTFWDKHTWKQALENRKDLTQEEIQQIIAWGETFWQPKAQQAANWLKTIQETVRNVSTSDADLTNDHAPGRSLPDIHLPDRDQFIEPLIKPVDTAREQVVGQISNIKGKLREKTANVRENLQDNIRDNIQQQAEAARRQVAIVAWWLFIALLSSGSAAASAGWIATQY
ncbi:MAG: hypothetical protein AAFU53_01385 [Cyanobacteria bacterium J06632_3]